MAHVASKILFHGELLFCVFLTHIGICLHLFAWKKTRIELLQRSVQFSARELQSETISSIFGWCQHQNNSRLSWSLLEVKKRQLVEHDDFEHTTIENSSIPWKTQPYLKDTGTLF